MKTNLILTTLVVLFLTSCTKSVIEKPEQIGLQVFDMLKAMDKKNADAYVANFMTTQDVKTLALKADEFLITNNKTREQMLKWSENDYSIIIKEDYEKIKESAKQYHINWSDVHYRTFEYDFITDADIPMCKGKLYFMTNGNVFHVKTLSLWDGQQYRLLKVEKLR